MLELGRFQGVIGIGLMLAIAFILSNDRRRINWRLVGWGLLLQILFALLILRTPVGKPFFDFVNRVVGQVIQYSNDGSTFVFRQLNPKSFETYEVVDSQSEETPPKQKRADRAKKPDSSLPAGTQLPLRPKNPRELTPSMVNVAFWILPTVIFFSALLAVLYHLEIMQKVIRMIAWVMQRTMGTSGAETLSVAGNIFVGQTEAPLMVRPYLREMTRSELMAVMVGGFATAAGGVLAVYIGFLKQDLPDIAGHLAAASMMSAPAAIVVAKILYPESGSPRTLGTLNVQVEQSASNVVEAFGDGVTQGLKLALNIGAMLIAFVAVVAMVNGILAWLTPTGREPLTMQYLLGELFRPLAWSLGVPWQEAGLLGSLMGEKIVLTELIAYGHLKDLEIGTDISQRTALIASYALCGFANFASIGIQLGGIGGMAPERKKDIAGLVIKAMVGGALASWMTAAIAGILL